MAGLTLFLPLYRNIYLVSHRAPPRGRSMSGRARCADNAHRSQACADCARLTDGAPGGRSPLRQAGARLARRAAGFAKPAKGGFASPLAPSRRSIPRLGGGKKGSRRSPRRQTTGAAERWLLVVVPSKRASRVRPGTHTPQPIEWARRMGLRLRGDDSKELTSTRRRRRRGWRRRLPPDPIHIRCAGALRR